MDKIYINAVGSVIPMQDVSNDEFADMIISGEQIVKEVKLSFDEYYKMKVFRRMDRFSILSILSFQKAIEDNGDLHINEYECSSIINTTYGPIETNIDFAESIVSDRRESVSPILFSHTVNNAALGHVCKKFNMKGPSTLTLSCNSIQIATSFIRSKKAKIVFLCGIEQYCDRLFQHMMNKGVNLKEVAVTIAIAGEQSQNSYAQILGYYEENMFGHPYLDEFDLDFCVIDRIMEKAIVNANIQAEFIDYAVIGMINSPLKNIEIELIHRINKTCRIISLKEAIGETLGASLNLNIAAGSILLKTGKVEKGHYVLVNNYDLSGNFISYVLGSVL